MKIACPRCGANINYVSDIEKCHCEYCGELIAIHELQDVGKNKDINRKESIDHLKEKDFVYEEYKCSSCGAKLISREEMLITDCIYCGSKQFIKDKLKEEFMPERIVPFKIKKEECITIYNNSVPNIREIPTSKINKLKITEIKGVYVPFHLFTYENVVNMQGEFIKKDLQYYGYGNEKLQYMHVKQGVKMEVPQCATNKMKSIILNKLEKYDYQIAEKFHPAYLMGFFAEIPNKPKESEEKRAEVTCLQEANNIIRRNGYHIKKGIIEGDIKELNHELLMLPMWFITCECEGKRYQFIINGQTGKFISLINIDKGRTPLDDFLMSFFSVSILFLAIYMIATNGITDDFLKKFVFFICMFLECISIYGLFKIYKKEKKKCEVREKEIENNPDALIAYSWNCNVFERKVYLERKYMNEEEFKKQCEVSQENKVEYRILKNGVFQRNVKLITEK